MACITRLLPFSGGNLLQPDESTVDIPIIQCGQKEHLATFITIGSAVVHLARHWTCASSRLHTHCPFLFLSQKDVDKMERLIHPHHGVVRSAGVGMVPQCGASVSGP